MAKAVRSLSKKLTVMAESHDELCAAVNKVEEALRLQAMRHADSSESNASLANEVRALLSHLADRPGKPQRTEQSSGTRSSPLSKFEELGAQPIDAKARKDIGQQRSHRR